MPGEILCRHKSSHLREHSPSMAIYVIKIAFYEDGQFGFQQRVIQIEYYKL